MSYSINFLNELGGNQGLDWAKTDPILIAIIKELSIRFLNPILGINMLFGWFGHVTDLIIDLTTVFATFGDRI